MSESNNFVVTGSPRFGDANLSALCQAQGAPAAWRAALSAADPSAAIRGVSGDFAVAMRDDTGRVVLAVDRFGIRSMCYRLAQGRLYFGSRADELATEGATLDPQAIFDYLYFHTIPSPRTIFSGVFRVPPGHFATYENGHLTVAPYWIPSFNEPSIARFEPLAQQFRGLLRAAVAAQLDGSKPACFLSGGTDSSTVAGLIGEVAGRPAATYSIGFEAAGYDEMAYARIAARRFGCEHHEYYVTPDDLVRHIPVVAAHYDQPFGNSSALPAFCCARMACDDGVSRLLAGDGGDELFGGNARYAKQRVFGWYGAVPDTLRHHLLEPLFLQSRIGRLPLLRKGASYIEQARTPMPDRMQMYNLLLRLGAAQVLTPEFLARVDQCGPAKQQREVWAQARAHSVINRTLAYDWRYTLAESDLPKVLGSTAIAGVAIGFPLLDQRLLEFSMGLPPSFKLKGLKLRWFFKEALRGYLPDEIIAKKKHGFGLPFGVWANRNAALGALAADSLRGIAARGVVRAEFVEALLNSHMPSHPGYYGEMVWILMMLEQWLRHRAPAFRIET
jgi:asparagine synthase (glutamine-hydrolysing)